MKICDFGRQFLSFSCLFRFAQTDKKCVIQAHNFYDCKNYVHMQASHYHTETSYVCVSVPHREITRARSTAENITIFCYRHRRFDGDSPYCYLSNGERGNGEQVEYSITA